MAGEESDRRDADLKARMDALAGKLAGQTPTTSDDDKPTDGAIGQAMSQGMRAMGEFVAAICVSALIGWQIDEWLHSSPAAILIFLALGTAAGFYNVYRVASKPTSGGRK